MMPSHCPAIDAGPRLDAFLRFRNDIDALYEKETEQKRIASLSRSIIVGLLLYNIYNITSFLLLPDIVGLSIALRLLLITPTSLALIWIIKRVNALQREWLMTIGMVNAIALPIFLFWYSDAALSAYTFGELPLSLVFGNMLLHLRFRCALVFTLAAFLLATLAVVMKDDLTPYLAGAFVVQFATGCIFSLYANWRAELARCGSHLAEFDAKLQAREADSSRKRFEDLSLTDALTGLPNRRALENHLSIKFMEAAPITLMMIDVDHFKQFNDSLGHPAGDDCLRKIAISFSDLTGPGDIFAARFGGEEFTVVLNNCSEFESVRIASTIVEAVRELDIKHPARPDNLGCVTVSIGVAGTHSASKASQTDLLEAADSALYVAKKRGRNRWVTIQGKDIERASSGSFSGG